MNIKEQIEQLKEARTQEIIDAIYEYCIMNKIIGFINTW